MREAWTASTPARPRRERACGQAEKSRRSSEGALGAGRQRLARGGERGRAAVSTEIQEEGARRWWVVVRCRRRRKAVGAYRKRVVPWSSAHEGLARSSGIPYGASARAAGRTPTRSQPYVWGVWCAMGSHGRQIVAGERWPPPRDSGRRGRRCVDGRDGGEVRREDHGALAFHAFNFKDLSCRRRWPALVSNRVRHVSAGGQVTLGARIGRAVRVGQRRTWRVGLATKDDQDVPQHVVVVGSRMPGDRPTQRRAARGEASCTRWARRRGPARPGVALRRADDEKALAPPPPNVLRSRRPRDFERRARALLD